MAIEFPYYPIPTPGTLIAKHQNDVIHWAAEFNKQIAALNELVAEFGNQPEGTP